MSREWILSGRAGCAARRPAAATDRLRAARRSGGMIVALVRNKYRGKKT
jgi:hypothetical protein